LTRLDVIKVAASLVITLTAHVVLAEDRKKLDVLCKQEGARVVLRDHDQQYRFWGTPGVDLHFSFSPVVGACIGTRVDYIRNQWDIQDFTSTFSDIKFVFACEKSGVSNMLLNTVRKYHGRIYAIPYNLWMDDGEGGPPKSNKEPSTPPTREKCDALFRRKLTELRLVDPLP